MATAHSGRRHHGSLVKLGNIDQAIGQRKVALDGHELVAHVHELLVTLCQQQDNGGSIGVLKLRDDCGSVWYDGEKQQEAFG